MGTRVLPIIVFDTSGNPYTDPTPPVATVQYADGDPTSVLFTQKTDGWCFPVDDTQDALVLWSGPGIRSDGITVPRIPTQVIVEATWSDNSPYLEGSKGHAVDNTGVDPSSLEVVRKLLTNKMVESLDGTTVTLYDDDSTTVLGVFTWSPSARTRGRLTAPSL